jgi:hypothetical protein
MRELQNLFHYFKKQWYFKYWLGAYLIILVILTVIFLLPNLLPPKIVKNGEINGLILRHQIWEGEIKIVGDTFSFPITHVTVTPGTKITIFKDNDRFNFAILPWYLKKGVNTKEKERDIETGEPFWDEAEKIQLRLTHLNAVGSEKNPIIITSDSSPGSRYDVNLIKISKGKLEFVNFSNYRRLEIGSRVLVSNSIFKNTGDCAICIRNGDPQVDKNTFSDSQKYFIDVSEGSPEIRDNKFLSSASDGIVFNGSRYSSILVHQNYFDMADRTSIRVLQMEEGGDIFKNYFNTGKIELPCSSKVKIEQNIINTQLIFKSLNICPQEYMLGENFWGISDIEQVLKARIVGLDNKTKVKILKVLDEEPFKPESLTD